MPSSSKYQGWLHSAFFSGLQKLSVPISGLLITMILAHKALTKQEMGVWALFMSITAIIELIRQGLVKTSLVRFINHSAPEEQKYVLSAALLLNIIITLLSAAVLFIFTPFLAQWLVAPQLKNMLYLLQIGMVVMIPFSHFEWLMYGKTQFKGLFWTYFFRQGFTLLFVVLIYFFSNKLSLNVLVIIYNGCLLIGTLVAYKYIRPLVTGTFVVSKIWVLKMLHFGKYVFGSNLSTLVFRSADQIMLSPLLGTTIFNASQNVAMRFVNLSDLPSQTLGDILFPKSARIENNNKGMLKYYYEKTVGASLCFVLPLVIFVLAFPKIIILVLAGSQYYDAVPYLQLISFTCIFLAFLKQYGVIMDSTGRPWLNLMSITIIAIIHVLLLYLFISNFGFIGAGYALLCSHTIGFIITQWQLHRLFKIDFLNSFKYAFQFYPEFAKIILHKMSWKTPA
jgi:lipopolysaccharide exporter